MQSKAARLLLPPVPVFFLSSYSIEGWTEGRCRFYNIALFFHPATRGSFKLRYYTTLGTQAQSSYDIRKISIDRRQGGIQL